MPRPPRHTFMRARGTRSTDVGTDGVDPHLVRVSTPASMITFLIAPEVNHLVPEREGQVSKHLRKEPRGQGGPRAFGGSSVWLTGWTLLTLCRSLLHAVSVLG